MASEQSRREMQQKTRLHDSFFGLKGPEPRPSSIATEIVDTDWDEDDDIISENEEDDGNNSPRLSLNSVRRPALSGFGIYLLTFSLLPVGSAKCDDTVVL